MDTRTGHLVADIEEIEAAERKNYTKVPKELENDAKAALAAESGGGQSYIDVNALTNLARWAQLQNHLKAVDVKRQKNRAKNKAARSARKANRGTNRGR